MAHRPRMNGWFSAWEAVMRLSGSRTNILSSRSRKAASAWGCSLDDPETEISDPMSLGFTFVRMRFTVCTQAKRAESTMRMRFSIYTKAGEAKHTIARNLPCALKRKQHRT